MVRLHFPKPRPLVRSEPLPEKCRTAGTREMMTSWHLKVVPLIADYPRNRQQWAPAADDQTSRRRPKRAR